MKPSAAVLGAIEVLKRRGWCQGKLENDAGQCCLLGALNHAIYGNSEARVEVANSVADWEQGLVKYQVLSLVRQLGPPVDTDLVYWSAAVSFNDHPDRTAAEVLGLLDRVKAKFESAGQ